MLSSYNLLGSFFLLKKENWFRQIEIKEFSFGEWFLNEKLETRIGTEITRYWSILSIVSHG